MVSFDGVGLGRFHQEVVDGAGRAEDFGGGVGGEGEDDDDE